MIAVESLQTATVMLSAVAWGTVVEMSAAHAVKAGRLYCRVSYDGNAFESTADEQPFLLFGTGRTIVQMATKVDDSRTKPLVTGRVGSLIAAIDYLYK